MLREDQIKLVMGPDNRPTGDAFVEIAGPGANLALALAKDRQVMPVRGPAAASALDEHSNDARQEYIPPPQVVLSGALPSL